MTEVDEAALRERPSDVLPDPSELFGPVDFDCETSGLHPDDGARVAAVGVAYRLKSDIDVIWHHAFPFDQGRAAEKGFEVVTFADTPTNRKSGVVGLPKGDPHGEWDWDTDYNLLVEEWRTFCLWLRGAGRATGLTNQNIAFDVKHMRYGTRQCRGIDLEPYVKWDPMLGSRRLWPRLGTTALKPVSAFLWGEEAVAEAAIVKRALTETKKRYGLQPEDGPRYDLLPWEVNGPYAAADTVLSLRLGEHQEVLLAEGEAIGSHIDRGVDVCRVLIRMERRGFGPYDVAQSTKIADRIDERIAELTETLPFTPASSPRAAKYFYDELGMAPWNDVEQGRVVEVVPDERKTAKPGDMRRQITKQGDLSASVARRMADAGVPHADTWAQITELTIANKMFYRNYAELAGDDDRLRTNFKQEFVRSGRLSVERWQAQALPKNIKILLDGKPLPQPRGLFGVAPGRRRMNLDLGQAELRIAALLCGCEVMSKALVTGADFHGITTTQVFSIGPDNPDWKDKRDIAKRLTFGGIFQIGGKKFQWTLWDLAGIYWPIRDCYQAVNAWRSAYPEFGVAYHDWLEFAERNLYVPLVDGSPSWLATARDYPNTAWNRRVQGSLALFANDWIVEVEKATAKYGALVLTVHDSCVLELPEDIADEVCAELAAMTETMWFERFGIPGKCDVSEWYEAK